MNQSFVNVEVQDFKWYVNKDEVSILVRLTEGQVLPILLDEIKTLVSFLSTFEVDSFDQIKYMRLGLTPDEEGNTRVSALAHITKNKMFNLPLPEEASVQVAE